MRKMPTNQKDGRLSTTSSLSAVSDGDQIEGLEQIWDNVKITKQKTQLPSGTEVDELIADMNIWDKKNKRERTGVSLQVNTSPDWQTIQGMALEE